MPMSLDRGRKGTLACIACWLTCMASSWASICVRTASVAGIVVDEDKER